MISEQTTYNHPRRACMTKKKKKKKKKKSPYTLFIFDWNHESMINVYISKNLETLRFLNIGSTFLALIEARLHRTFFFFFYIYSRSGK
jgi:hypothetical protein